MRFCLPQWGHIFMVTAGASGARQWAQNLALDRLAAPQWGQFTALLSYC
jgi:hypothetical protein